jgi:hypothetical protein
VLAKSDAAALGVHGIAMRHATAAGKWTAWAYHVFDDPQAPDTRVRVMSFLGDQIAAATSVLESATGSAGAVHLVTPDAVTCDVLVAIADSLAGVEISRLRWRRDFDMGRPALTFNGEPASVPKPLSVRARLAVSFLLEADRARAMLLRNQVVDVVDAVVRADAVKQQAPAPGRSAP